MHTKPADKPGAHPPLAATNSPTERPTVVLFPLIANLHESTVTHAEQHTADWKPVRPRRASIARATDAYGYKVDARLWRYALKAAEGDASRIVVESATSLLIMNRSQRTG